MDTYVRPSFYYELAERGLSDAAALTHTEAIAHFYRVEDPSLVLSKRQLRSTIRLTERYEDAAVELVEKGVWAFNDAGDYVVVHHAAEVRSQLTARSKKRTRDAGAQAARRTPANKALAASIAAGNEKCTWCGRTEGLVVDHIVARSRGGSLTDPSNLQVLCAPCNSSKCDRDWNEWKAQGGYGGGSA